MSGQPDLFPDSDLFEAVPAADGAAAGEAAGAGGGAAREAVFTDGPLKKLFDGNFLNYASYVIRDRAIPDLDDGLKPVQRRILYSLHEKDDGKFTKVANIVGHAMQYHPHGDASIADALIVLTNKQYLIEGQGNFGNLLTGDPPAASRYIECRLTGLARDELFHEALTDFVPSYDGRRREPVTLPARIPLLLLLGAEGIAVGISTRILPHNFRELIEAQIAILGGEPFELFPDFPQGGLMDASGYQAGRGQVRVRAGIEKREDGALVIREIPCGTTTDSVIASIEEAARKGKIKVRSINDFTAGRVEIEVRLQAEEDPDRAIEALYAFSQCQVQVSSRVVVIRDRKPVELDVHDILRHNTQRLKEILRRELMLERRRLGEELHRRTLVELFIEGRLYKRIEECETPEAVEATVRAALETHRDRLEGDITARDIEGLLEIPIRRISRFDLEKNRRDMQTVREKRVEAEKNLRELVPHTVRYLRGLLRKHGEAFPRRTRLTAFEAVELREITATELTICHDREKGYIGSGIKGEPLLQCSSYDRIVVFWADGRYKVMAPPEKLFVDAGCVYVGKADRDRVLTVVFTLDLFTYARKFTLGGFVTNREYRCAPRDSRVLMLADDDPPVLYARYKAGAQQIRQQEFKTAKLPVREAKSRGAMMTSKTVAFVSGVRPADWNEKLNGPRGSFHAV